MYKWIHHCFHFTTSSCTSNTSSLVDMCFFLCLMTFKRISAQYTFVSIHNSHFNVKPEDHRSQIWSFGFWSSNGREDSVFSCNKFTNVRVLGVRVLLALSISTDVTVCRPQVPVNHHYLEMSEFSFHLILSHLWGWGRLTLWPFHNLAVIDALILMNIGTLNNTFILQN